MRGVGERATICIFYCFRVCCPKFTRPKMQKKLESNTKNHCPLRQNLPIHLSHKAQAQSQPHHDLKTTNGKKTQQEHRKRTKKHLHAPHVSPIARPSPKIFVHTGSLRPISVPPCDWLESKIVTVTAKTDQLEVNVRHNRQ